MNTYERRDKLCMYDLTHTLKLRNIKVVCKNYNNISKYHFLIKIKQTKTYYSLHFMNSLKHKVLGFVLDI